MPVNHVLVVRLVVSEIEMRWAYTGRVLAAVEHIVPRGVDSYGSHGKPMSWSLWRESPE